VAIIVACLPAVRSLLSQVFPRVFGSATQNRSRIHNERSGMGFTKRSTILTKKGPTDTDSFGDDGDSFQPIDLTLGDKFDSRMRQSVTPDSGRDSEEELRRKSETV
jgi:hypothetical protein